MSAPTPNPLVIKLPRTAYLAVVFLLVASFAVAFGDSQPHSLQDSKVATGIAGVDVTWRLLVFLLPLAVAVFVARTATVVSPAGVRVRALFGSRFLPWGEVRGLSVGERALYAVLDDGAVRLPCTRVAHLAALAKASGGHLPAMAEARPKPAPARRRR
ncbi:MAG TPA: PH domain-containing protein [Jatrophihabitans sp.]|nr:PH domain-containing protein [Jatrophihabitans sp.]